mmetsp:Transcript_126263/g.318765  ORF Transcript_126263/g.318765 Transcript_126263/m.318765 type:complete len:89 (-) Transcript_126263:245-511(-)
MRKMPTKRYKYGQAMNFLRVIIAMQALLAPSETTLPGKNSSHQHKSCSAAVLVSPKYWAWAKKRSDCWGSSFPRGHVFGKSRSRISSP